MNRKLKALGLAVMAVLAMSAVVVASAQAADEFTAASYPTIAKGSQEGLTVNNYFEITGNKFHCETIQAQATITGPTKELTVTPHLGLNNGQAGQDCIATGFELKTTVTLNGCDLRLTTHGTDPSGNVTATGDVVCPAGKQGEIHVGGLCTIDIPPQTGLTGVTFTNGASDSTVTIDIDITNQITAIETKPSIFCPFTNGAHTLVSFVGQGTVQCFDDLGTEAGPTGANTTYKAGAVKNCDVA